MIIDLTIEEIEAVVLEIEEWRSPRIRPDDPLETALRKIKGALNSRYEKLSHEQ